MTGETTVIGFVLDLSDRKRAEAAQQEAACRERELYSKVQAAKEQLETVLASINDQFLVLDREWRYVYVNDRVGEAVGISREDLLGKCIWEVFPETVSSQFYVEVHRAAAEQRIIHLEYFYSPWQRWFENHIYPSATGVSILVTEITERKRAEETLQRTNQTLQTLIDACPIAIAFFDSQGIVKLWNRAAEGIFGWSAGEAIGQFMPTVPHRPQEFLTSIQTVLSGKSLCGFEAQHQCKDGRMVDLEIWANLTYDAEGNPGCLGIAMDITQRKLSEVALRTSEERYRSLVATTTAVVWTTNAEGGFISSQPSWEAYTGQCREEYAGWGWLEMIHLEDREIIKARWEYALAERSVYEAEGRIWHGQSGQHRHMIARAVPLLNADGSVREWIGTDTDIHEQKQVQQELQQTLQTLQDSEERLRLALMAANLGLYDLNVQTGDALVSPEYARMLGYEPEEFQETNAKWRNRLHPNDVAEVYRVYEDYVARRRDDYRVEFRQQTKSGDWKWILSIGKIVSWDSDGKPLRMLGTHSDITDRKLAEAEREQLLVRSQAAREQAETANRIKDEFLAVLSHELRSPLNPILGWAKLLRNCKLDEQKTAYALETIERNAQLQTQLIGDLLDVSRILQGKLSLNIAPVDLANAIAEAVETVRLAAEAKSIQIETALNSTVGKVAGDSGRLQQIIWNLLANAVKFTPEGGRVEICLERVGTQAQITVSDTGKGISPDFLPYVFDCFRQADSTTTRKFGGLGLGLAIVRHLTELHGGMVTVQSLGEGKGATFTLRLPLINKGGELDNEASSNSSTHELAALPLAGLQILVVDDEVDTRDYISFVLEQAGANAISAASGEQALQLLMQFTPDILLSDIGMPEMDGYMLIRLVRGMSCDRKGEIPAIALTAYAGEMNQQQALAAGFQQHISKPVEPEQLVSAIVKVYPH